MTHIDPIDPTMIVAALTGRASEEEVRELAAWRARSRANDEEYRTLARLWLAAGDEGDTTTQATPAVPDAHTIVARAAERRMNPLPEARLGDGGWGRRRLTAWAAAGLAASLTLGIGIGRVVLPTQPAPFGLESLITGPNEVATIRLRDSTVVRLAPLSTLRFPMTDGAREVSLVGRAFFTVAKDADRPFRVRLPSGDIEVLGTRFDVQSRDQRLQVAVVEGQVRVEAHGARFELEANEVADVPREGAPEVRRVDDPYAIIDWLGRFLAFESTPVGDVVEELERRFGLVVEVDEELSDRTLTGWFADQTPEDVLASVCTVLEAACSVEGGVVRMQGAPSGVPGGGGRR